MELPPDLRLALERAAQGVSLQRLQQAAGALSERYREQHGRATGSFLTGPDDVVAYATTRMPATWAAIHAALEATAMQCGDWQPDSLSDVGAGPGTVAWAATGIWPSLTTLTLLERDAGMVRLGRQLAEQARHAGIRVATWLSGDLVSATLPKAELVTAAYVVGELPTKHLDAATDRLWEATEGLLVIVEPGTPRGFALIRQMRERLLAAGAQIVAPCPHAAACPMLEGDWCHASARVARSRLHRATKSGERGFEDEKFAYVAVARFACQPAAARVLRHPYTSAGRITLELCTPAGLQQPIITKRDPLWRDARNAEWGGVFPDPPRE